MSRKIILLLSLSTAAIVLFLLVPFWWPIGKATKAFGRPVPRDANHRTDVALKLPSSHRIPQPPPRPYEGISDPRWEWWKTMQRKDLKFEWKMEISFYGMVVDESSQPVEGVEVLFGWTDLSTAGNSTCLTRTDASGRFDLTAATGKALVVRSLKKEGYYTSKKNSRFGFEYAAFFDSSYHHPDPSSPVIFRLRKKGTPEPMIHHRKLFGFEPDGTVSYIDLAQGRKRVGGAPMGDISVRITRQPLDTAEDYAWTFTIETIGRAGLKESDEEFMFLAPESGYTVRDHYEFRPGQPNYRKDLEKKFYFRTDAGGHYGRLEILALPKYNNRAAIDMAIYVNPSGSRNLEFDPRKVVGPGRPAPAKAAGQR